MLTGTLSQINRYPDFMSSITIKKLVFEIYGLSHKSLVFNMRIAHNAPIYTNAHFIARYDL
jgi:hypothetical protein